MFIKVFDKDSITGLDWASVENGILLRPFLEPLVIATSRIFVKNSDHRFELLQVENQLYPLSLGQKSNNNTCYLLSFLSQYVDYTREEVLSGNQFSRNQKLSAKFLFPILRKLGYVLGMERVVFVNNWLLATNLYDLDTLIGKPSVIAYLKKKYPQRAIAFRSVNDATDMGLLEALREQGGLPLACRQIYVLDVTKGTHLKKRPVVQDRKLWERSDHLYWEQVAAFQPCELNSLLHYYDQLYLKKYSSLNPDYTTRFLETSQASTVLQYYILRDSSQSNPLAIQAVEKNNTVICTPLIGYDPQQPKEMGLYRLMHHQLAQLAVAEGKTLNMSSGASRFKKQRGGVPYFDYHVILSDHLPKRRRWIWKKLFKFSESQIKPTLLKLQV